jgi:hypothetical protein
MAKRQQWQQGCRTANFVFPALELLLLWFPFSPVGATAALSVNSCFSVRVTTFIRLACKMFAVFPCVATSLLLYVQSFAKLLPFAVPF